VVHQQAHHFRRSGELTPRSAAALGEADWLRARHFAGNLVNPIRGGGGMLAIAVRQDRPDMLQLLLDMGFDPDERTRLDGVDEERYTIGHPLHIAAGQNKRHMAEMLLKHGAKPNAEVYASGSVMYSALQ